MSNMEFEYYYGAESEQYSFYRVPRLLIKDKRFSRLSSDAKLLYGLMLDRMSLSMKNGWFDEENRAYIIYTIDNIRKDLGGCSKEKAVKVLAELDARKGIGLVEKIHRGLGKPDIIYVKNFATLEKDEINAANADVSAEVGKTDFKESEKPTSRSRENRLQEVGKTDPNYNDKRYSDYNYINPIDLSDQELVIPASVIRKDSMDDEADSYKEIVRNNIDYNSQLRAFDDHDRDIYRELYELICDIVCVKREQIRINGVDYPYELVRERFLQLNSAHLEYVMDSLNKTATKITNIRAYLTTVLFNAPVTMINMIDQEVRYDMYGGGWEGKGILQQYATSHEEKGG